MNSFMVIIVAALAFNFILNLIAAILNLQQITSRLPNEAKNFYNQDQYCKSQEYLAKISKFRIFTETFELILIFCFWFIGGFNSLDQWLRAWNFTSVITGLLYVGILLLGQNCFMILFRVYSTFVIETKFGFNRTDCQTFIQDLFKSFFLYLIFGAPILAIIFWLFQIAGNWAPLFCWVSFSIYLLSIQYIAPSWLMPLFFKFSPIEDGPLKEALLAYARSIDFPLTQIHVIDGSRRSSKANAFFTGFGRQRRVALFDTLIEQHSIPEIEAVLAHEIGHYKKKHVLKNLIFSLFHIGIIFFCLSFFMNSREFFDAFLMDHMSIYAALVFFSLLFSPINNILLVLSNFISRQFEYEADRFAVQTISNPESLIKALKKLSINSLSNLNPHPFYVFMNESHPPVLKRIQTIRKAIFL